ncbi:MAG TPA: hypothetical protein VHO70_09040 [Chitinispirillaceae bacterium]|nr:hypothetical protein [Chitinispirillaceae bacterium]
MRKPLILIVTIILFAAAALAVGMYSLHDGDPRISRWEGKYTVIKAMLVETDSLSEGPADNLCFRLRIDPSNKIKDKTYFHNSDILFGYGRTREEIGAAVNDFNFHLSEKIWLRIREERVFPTLCHFERNFGLDNGRDVWVNFRLDQKQRNMLKNEKDIRLHVNSIFQKEKVAILKWPVKKNL